MFHASPLRGERIFGRALARKRWKVRRYSADTPNNLRQAGRSPDKGGYRYVTFPSGLIPSPEFLNSLTFIKKFYPFPQGAKETKQSCGIHTYVVPPTRGEGWFIYYNVSEKTIIAARTNTVIIKANASFNTG